MKLRAEAPSQRRAPRAAAISSFGSDVRALAPAGHAGIGLVVGLGDGSLELLESLDRSVRSQLFSPHALRGDAYVAVSIVLAEGSRLSVRVDGEELVDGLLVFVFVKHLRTDHAPRRRGTLDEAAV